MHKKILAGLLLTAVFLNWCKAQPFMELFNPQIGTLSPSAEYEFSWYGDEDVHVRDNAFQDQAGNLSSMNHSFSALIPLYQDQTQETAFITNVELMDLDSRVRFPRNGASLPSELWNVEFGGVCRKRFENGWTGAVMATIGSASDKPFDSFDEVSFNAFGSLTMPTGRNTAWLFVLYASAPREYLPGVPLPGVAYYWRPDENLEAVIGLPLMLRWQLDERTRFSGFVLPYNVETELAYALMEEIDLYAGFSWDNEEYLRSGREQFEDMLTYFDKKVKAGVRFPLQENLFIDCQAGFAFDRFFFEDEDYDDRDKNRIDVGDGFYGKITTGLSF